MVNNYPSEVSYIFRYDLFSNRISFGMKKPFILTLEFDYFAISHNKILHLKEINIV